MMTQKTFKIVKVDNVYSKCLTDHPSIMGELIKHMSIFADNYRFMPKYKAGIWDGKINFVDYNGKFATGLLSHVYNFIKKNDLNVIIDDELTSKNLEFEDEFNQLTSVWLDEKFSPRDYQLEGAIKAIKFKRGILEHATSAGKSLTIAMIGMYLYLSKKCKKILILVPSVSLVEQMYSDFKNYGIDEKLLGMFYEKEKNSDRLITISTWQSMYTHKDLITDFDCIFADEAHMQKADQIRSVGMNAINCQYRIGTSGTISELPKSQKYLIEGVLGPIIHKVLPGFLIEHGYASDVNIKLLFLNHTEKTKKELKGLPYDVEIKWVEAFLPRYKIINKLVETHHEKDHNLLILFDHIDHGERILESLKYLEKTGSKIFLVTGDTPAKKREEIRKYVNNNKKCVIVGTYGVFSTGVSINRLHSIIFAIAGKSMVRVLQSIGRGMRLHCEKTGVVVYDICDDLHYSKRHLEERINIYDKAEYKFSIKEINIKDS